MVGLLKKIKQLGQGYSLRRRQNRDALVDAAVPGSAAVTTQSTPEAVSSVLRSSSRRMTRGKKQLRIKTHIRIVNLVVGMMQ